MTFLPREVNTGHQHARSVLKPCNYPVQDTHILSYRNYFKNLQFLYKFAAYIIKFLKKTTQPLKRLLQALSE